MYKLLSILFIMKLYVQIIIFRIIRGIADEPVALKTKLVYGLSGKLDTGSNGWHQINLNESLITNVLRVQTYWTKGRVKGRNFACLWKWIWCLWKFWRRHFFHKKLLWGKVVIQIKTHGMLDDNFLLFKSRLND